jgi:hypothetical protein
MHGRWKLVDGCCWTRQQAKVIGDRHHYRKTRVAPAIILSVEWSVGWQEVGMVLVRPFQDCLQRPLHYPASLLTSWYDAEIFLHSMGRSASFVLRAFARAWLTAPHRSAVPGACCPCTSCRRCLHKADESQCSARRPGGDAARMEKLAFRVAPSSMAAAPTPVHPSYELFAAMIARGRSSDHALDYGICVRMSFLGRRFNSVSSLLEALTVKPSPGNRL